MASETHHEDASDEAMRKLLKPDPTKEQVIEILQLFYAKKDTKSNVIIKKELDSYDDKNYWVNIDGTDYLAKIHNGVESKDLLDHCGHGHHSHGAKNHDISKSVIYLQNRMMDHLSQQGVTTSQPQIPNIEDVVGEPLVDKIAKSVHAIVRPLPVLSKTHSPCRLVVRLMSWVPGRPMESVPLLPLESIADSGRFLGKMQLALAKIDPIPDAAKRYHQWDGKNTADLKQFVSCIQDTNRRAMVESVITTFEKELVGETGVAKNMFPTALIHGDFNDANILLNDDLFVSGVIDFGDSVESWRILDVTVGIAYSMLSSYGKQGRAISAAAAFLRGYHSVMTVTEEERKHLVLLIACRLACSATLGAYSYQQAPENEYLLLHATPAWNTLQLIWAGTDDAKRAKTRIAIDRIFDLACSKAGGESGGVIDCSDLAFPDPRFGDPLEDIRVCL